MRAWRLLLQTIGVLNLALSVWGCYFLADAVLREFRHPHADPRWPFFGEAFWTQCGINVLFLVAFVFVSVMLLKLRPRAAIAHTCIFFALFLYVAVPGVLWLLPGGVGRSIAAASGVGNMGIGPLLFFPMFLVNFPMPFVYPLISILCVNVAWYRLKAVGADVTSAYRHG
jgi:hypothetical protein